MSSYRWIVEFREIHHSIAWRSLYRFGYQSCWHQFLVFLGKPWENHFISLCCNPISLMVVCNGKNRITPREGQSKTAPDERQTGQNIPNFLPYCTGGSWIPDSPTLPARRVAAVSEEGSAAGTWMKDEVPWNPEQDRSEEGTSKSHLWTRKRCDFHPWKSFMFIQVKESCKFPWVSEDFLWTCEGELAAPRRAKGVLTPNSSGPWFTGSLILFLFLFTAGFWAFPKLLLTGNSLL